MAINLFSPCWKHLAVDLFLYISILSLTWSFQNSFALIFLFQMTCLVLPSIQVDEFIGRDHLFKKSIILIKAWCYYESRILGAPHGLISTYALETLVLYIINLFHSSLHGPLEVFPFLFFACLIFSSALILHLWSLNATLNSADRFCVDSWNTIAHLIGPIIVSV